MRHATFRYADDNPELYGFRTYERDAAKAIRSQALSQHVRVSDRVLPAVFGSIERTRCRLGLGRDAQVFVYPSPDTNAHCCSGSDNSPVLVFVSSALVNLVRPEELDFVIGHEFGHFLFEHHAYPTPQEAGNELRYLELRRASEISADRIGLVACEDIEVALRAILKVASGLDESNLEIDVAAYLRQVRDLQIGIGDESLLYSSHPPFPLRARALLRFDSVLSACRAGEDVQDLSAKGDADTRRDMDRAAHGVVGNQFTDAAASAAFWDAASEVAITGDLAESDRTQLASIFGEEKVAALLRAISTRSSQEARKFIAEKQKESKERLISAPIFVTRAVQDVLRRFT